MGRKPKTVKVEEVKVEQKVEIDPAPQPDPRLEERAIVKDALRLNGISGLNEFEYLIQECLPKVIANNSTKYPVIHEGAERDVRYIIDQIEKKDEKAAQTLYQVFKRNSTKTAATIYLRLRLLELED